MKPIIMTDASCDLPIDFIEKNNIPFLGLMCHFKGEEYEDDFGKSLSYEEFYNGLKEGEIPCTSQINVFRFTEKFKELLEQKRPIIYLGMSSGLSGTFNSAKIARENVIEEFKDADITLIDTKASSAGLGLIVYHAYEMLDKGTSKDEIIKWVEENKNQVNNWFVVEDLKHLKKGGRISSSKAVIGTLLDIKPIIRIDEAGKLENVTTIRGRKRAVKYIIEKFKEKAIDKQQVITISHAYCLEDAEALKSHMLNEFGVKDVIIGSLGLGMGAHCGPGMISLCFIGKER